AVIRVETFAQPRMPAVFPGIQPFLIRSSSSATRLTQSAAAAGAMIWTAAGKPFGYLANDTTRVRPDAYAIVLPAFQNVRLIPVDAATGSNIGAYDLAWRRHIQDHLPTYMLSGQAGLEDDCWYCQQLQVWEDQFFRQQGIDWLSDTNHTCDQVTGGGGGPGGGTRRGH
ncbi:MAG: hypothetical protein Q8O57_04480, partial [Kiritimatiellota bacterium]|nr:hypothetical protein [Kiritimatiellota bacterium]